MNRRRRSKRDEITRIRVRLRTAVHKIDVHLGQKVVFLLLARQKEKFLSNRDIFGGALTFDAAIRLSTQGELVHPRIGWLFDKRTDWQLIF